MLLVTLISFGTFFANYAYAHVGYVVQSLQTRHGTDYAFIFSPLQDPFNIMLLLLGALVLTALVFLPERINFIKTKARQIREIGASYYELFPWMLRLSLGIALIGDGALQSLISPVLQASHGYAILEFALGFFILAGFLTTPALILAGILYLIAITETAYIFGNLEFLGAVIASLTLGNMRPGVDDLFRISIKSPLVRFKPYALTILRISIGAAFAFLALYEKILNPHLSEAVVNQFNLTNIVPVTPEMWVLSAGLIELLVGLAILIGFRTRTFAALAFMVISITFFFFNEAVYSHVTLFGVLSILFAGGGGKWSLDEKLENIKNTEAVIMTASLGSSRPYAAE